MGHEPKAGSRPSPAPSHGGRETPCPNRRSPPETRPNGAKGAPAPVDGPRRRGAPACPLERPRSRAPRIKHIAIDPWLPARGKGPEPSRTSKILETRVDRSGHPSAIVARRTVRTWFHGRPALGPGAGKRPRSGPTRGINVPWEALARNIFKSSDFHGESRRRRARARRGAQLTKRLMRTLRMRPNPIIVVSMDEPP